MMQNIEAELNGRLSPEHLAMLRDESGISDEISFERGCYTETDEKALAKLGFVTYQRRVPALVIPLHTVDGETTYIIRPDNPRVKELRKKGKLRDGTYPQKVIKYEQPRGSTVRLDVHPRARQHIDDPSVPLFITEGQKKADCLLSRGAECVIALTGVNNWRGTNAKGGKTTLADFQDIALNGRDVYLIPDSDVNSNSNVNRATSDLRQVLQNKGAHVSIIYLSDVDGEKVGVDDWLVANPSIGIDGLIKAHAEGPRPEIIAAPPQVKLLDEAPATIRRPISLIDGRAYAAVWAYVEVTVSEKIINGEVRKLKTPEVTLEKRLFIVRDDGIIFGEGAQNSFEDLGIHVNLPFAPKSEQIMSTPALKRYASGERADAVNVFRRIVEVVDHFIDFNRSLASQRTMCEMVACFVLSTYFLPAWMVAGYLWPNGERGSGKTQLLTVIVELGYLGTFTTAGGTFAALRDLADYGATLGIDDAENVSDYKRIDPDKRALLLAGNRHNSSTHLKEQVGKGKWELREVSTFACRGFSAIGLPDPTLASRSIVVPLIRTPDRTKGNEDPSDHESWPYPRRQLIDDQWALTLEHLPSMPNYWKEAGKKARLMGRNLEPWRAILAVALWLEDMGVTGLFGRIEQLSMDYQKERPNLEYGDVTVLIIRAVGRVFGEQVSAAKEEIGCEGCEGCEMCEGIVEGIGILSHDVAEVAKMIIRQEDLDISAERLTPQRTGTVLGKMRLEKWREPGTGKYGRFVHLSDLKGMATAYGMELEVITGLTIKPSQGSLTSLPSQVQTFPNGSDPESTEREVTDKEIWQGVI